MRAPRGDVVSARHADVTNERSPVRMAPMKRAIAIALLLCSAWSVRAAEEKSGVEKAADGVGRALEGAAKNVGRAVKRTGDNVWIKKAPKKPAKKKDD